MQRENKPHSWKGFSQTRRMPLYAALNGSFAFLLFLPTRGGGGGLKSITAQKSPRKVTSLPGNVIKLSVVFYKTPCTEASCFWYGVFFFLPVHGVVFQVFLQGLLDDERLRDARFFFLQYTSSRSSSSGGILNVLAGQSVFLSLSPITRPPFLPRPASH